MALLIPPGYANLTLTITNANGGASGVSSVALGFKCLLAPWDQGNVNAVSNLVRDGLTPRYDNGFTLGPTHVVLNDGGTLKAFDDTGTEAGTHSAYAAAPPATAIIVSKQTGLVGRRHRGRLFMPAPDEGQVDDAGVLNGTERNLWQTTMDDLRTSLLASASVDDLVLFHDESTPGASSPDVITSFVVRNVVGTMRPRQRR